VTRLCLVRAGGGEGRCQHAAVGPARVVVLRGLCNHRCRPVAHDKHRGGFVARVVFIRRDSQLRGVGVLIMWLFGGFVFALFCRLRVRSITFRPSLVNEPLLSWGAHGAVAVGCPPI